MKKNKVIIDCDPGIDDALALALAINSPELDIIGITICSGNVVANIGASNALKVLDFYNRLDIPVYIGESVPIKRKLITAQDTHGDDGLGESEIIYNKEIYPLNGGIDFIIDSLNAYETLSILALGPLTNIATALKISPESFKSLDRFVSMGGAYEIHGNCSPVAEFNYWVDPDAAQYVFDNLPVKLEMVGLDVTRKIVLTPNIIALMYRLNVNTATFVDKITRFYMDFHWTQENVIGCVINDPLVIAYFINPEICHGFSSYTQVNTEGIGMGETIVDSMDFYKKTHNSIILDGVDSSKFMCFFLDRLFPGNTKLIKHHIGGKYE